MNTALWLNLLGRILAGVLVTQGKKQAADYLSDLLEAAKAGHDVDDLMTIYAAKWAQSGEPSFDEIADERRKLQAKIGGRPA